jgi:NAD(P)-dependent dehydrogenase (short-subunit alcohol dehydrogenase family)
MTKRFDGRRVLVMGGANGMGLACVKRFADEGAAVVVADVLEDAGNEAVRAVNESGGRGYFVQVDMRDDDAVRGLVPTVVGLLGGLDVVAITSGIPVARYRSGAPDPRGSGSDALTTFLGTTAAEWDEVNGVNVRGPFLLVQAAVAEMVPHRAGSIVLVTSLSGTNPTLGGAVPYCASKAAEHALAKTVAHVVAKHGIRVNAVGPGLIATNMSRGYLAAHGGHDAVVTSVPMSRPGTPEEIAAAVTFLASDDASFITGETLFVDGGQFGF